jgi:ABC-2 type transport system permease protein
MSTLVVQIRLETNLLLRDKRSLFFTLAFPVIMILIFGSVFSGGSWDGIPAINYLLPGIIVMAVMMACMNNNAVKITNDREKGIYRRLSLTPLKRQTLLAGHVFVRYLIMLASTALLIAIGVGVFKAQVGGNYFLFWFVLTVGALVFIALGFVLSSVVKNSNSANALGTAVLFPFMFLGASFWPLEQMPLSLRPVCEALPALHLNTALRVIVVQQASFSVVWHEFPVMLGWLAGCSILAVKFFKWE